MIALPPSDQAWVSATLANRAIITPVSDTQGFIGRIKGLPKALVTGDSEDLTLRSLQLWLETYAENCIILNAALPVWEVTAPEVSDDAWSLVRVSTLRKLLKQRAGQWGASRQQLPVYAAERCLAEIDAVVTRHAMQLPPPHEASLK